MNNLKDTYTLCNGVNIPCVGFGTWQTPNGETCYKFSFGSYEMWISSH